MPEIAALSVAVTADTSQLEAGLSRANQSVQGFGSQLSSIGAAAGTALAGVGVAAAAGFGAAIKTAADFEKQMSAVGAVAGASAQEMQQLTAAALQLGKDTSFSASEAATGIEELVKAGVSIKDVLGGGARAALDLAAAGAISVGDAAEIASNALNVFGLKGADMAHVADTIAGAANASAIGVNDYKFSLSAAGAVAATVGISFESLSQAIAVMGNAGIKGSDAGTSLKTMLLNLQPSTKAQAAEFHRLGLVTAEGANQFFTAEGKAKSFAEIAGVLQKAMAGMTKQQQLASLEILFGADAIRAGAVLLDAGTKGFEDMAAAMGKVTAQAVAEERLNNLWGSVEKLKGSLETGAIMLGGLFTPAIKTFVDQITDGVNQSIEIIEQLPDAWRTAGQAFEGGWEPSETLSPFINMVGEAAIALKAQFGPAIQAVSTFLTGTLAPAIQAVGQFFAEHTEFVIGFVAALGTILGMAAVQAVLAGIAAAIALLLSPIALVTAAITLLVAAWVGNWFGIQEAVATAWAAMEPTFTALVDWLGVQIPKVLDFLTTTAWPAFVTAAQAVGAFITGTLIPAFTAVVLWLGTNIPPVVAWISETGWPALVTAGTAVTTFITGTLIPGVTSLIDWLGPKLVPVVTWISDTGWPALVTAGTAVVTMVQQVIQFFTDLFTELEKRGVFTELGQMWTTVVAIGETLAAIIVKITAVFAPFQAITQEFNAGAGGALITTLGAIVTAATGGASAIDVIATAVKNFAGVINAQLQLIKQFLDMLNQISQIKMPSFNLPGFGGGGGATQLSMTTGGGSAHVGQYLPLINQVSAETGVPADVLAALMEVEGSGAGSTSPAGARGLMQVMPNYVRPGEDPFDPLTSIREGARAVTEKFNATGSWSGAGRAYFGYGVDAGGMDTNTYGARYDAARARYQSSSTGPGAINKMMTGDPGATPDQWPGFMQQTWEQLPQYLQSLDTIQQAGTLAFDGTAQAGIDAGTGLVSASTDSLGNVTRIYSDATGVIGATITDAAGVIVNQWGTAGAGAVTAAQTMNAGVTTETATMAAGVAANTNLMASGALTSVTALGTGTLTTVQTISGTTIATVTDMQGQVTSQYATLANGAQLTMGDMAAGVLTSTTDLGTGVMTTVQDMSGNYITTITDLSGNVTSQYVQLAADVTAAATEQAAGVTEQATTMTKNVLTSVTDLGDGVLTITTDMSGQTIATVTDMAGNVTSTYSSMGSDVVGSVTDLGQTVVEQFNNVASEAQDAMGPIEDFGSALVDIPQADMSDTVKQFGAAAEAAKKAQKAIKALADATEDLPGSFGGSKGGKSGFGKASGGTVLPGQEYLVGEQGPEWFMPSQSGTVIPHALSSGSGGRSEIVFVIRQPDGKTLAEWVVTGQRLAAERGRV